MGIFEIIFHPNTLLGIGAVIFAIAYGYRNFFAGIDKAEEKLHNANRELIATLTGQLNAERASRETLQVQVNDLQQKIGKLEGVNQELFKKVEEYTKLFGPAGELKNTLELLVKNTENGKVVQNEAIKFIKDMREGKLKLP